MKKLKLLLATAFILMLTMNSFSQGVGINNDESDADPSAMLDVKSTDKGMLVPRMTVAQAFAIINPAEGLLVWASDVQSFLYYKSGTWNYLTSEFAREVADFDFDTKITTGDGLQPDDDLVKIYCGNYSLERFIIDSMRIAPNMNSVFIGRKAGGIISDKENVAIGDSALFFNGANATTNIEGNYNTSLGSNTLVANDKGSFNTANGYESLRFNSLGSGNTASGFGTLTYNITGNYNSAIGTDALRLNSSGYSNVAIGVCALNRNTERSNLVAIGDSALYHNGEGATTSDEASYNTALGSKALYSNTTGYSNSATGYQALYSNTTGYGNSATGYLALYSNTTGFGNTALGTDAYFFANNLNNTTCIGFFSGDVNNVSNHIEIGNTSVNWIGGQVTWSTYSDKRIKKDIQSNVAGLDFITRLRPVTYHLDIHKQNEMVKRGKKGKKEADWPEKYDIENQLMSGFIAQEVEQAAQDAGYDFSGVQQAKDDLGMYSVSYAQFVVPLVKAVQEQQQMIEELKAEIETLKKQVDK